MKTIDPLWVFGNYIMYPVKTPKFVKGLFPSITWKGERIEKTVYLTFDDGPVPEATPWVLDLLAKHNAKASFFCVGDNVELHPDIYERIKNEGHVIGNHSNSHISGWEVSHDEYLSNIAKATTAIKSNLFRPPYGKMTYRQMKSIQENFKIIMWDILSGDFDQKISPEKCFANVMNNLEAGSIIVFHDSKKSIDKLKAFLPRLMDQLVEEGYSFKLIGE